MAVTSMSEAPWFIVRTIRLPYRDGFSKKSGPIEIWLERLGGFGWETYYPLIRELRRVPNRWLGQAHRNSKIPIIRPRLMPFLPGYVFVRGGKAGELKRLPCVAGCVESAGKKPAEISHELITGIRAREADGAISGAFPATAIFAPGDQIMVADGPFASLIGTVERVPKIAIADLSVPTRLKLTLDIFGRTTRVDVPLSAIRNVRVRRLAAKPFPTRPEALSQ
jgi:transcription antitermination factor NusG